MKQLPKWILLSLMLTTWSAAATAVELIDLGTLDNGLRAPTSICVTENEIAVLEPTYGRLVVLSITGTQLYDVRIEGMASGLACDPLGNFLFCDRSRHVVVSAGDGGTVDFSSAAVDPIDVVAVGEGMAVLDAAIPAVLLLNAAGDIELSLPIRAPDNSIPRSPASLAWEPISGEFHVLDQVTSRIFVLNSDGEPQPAYAGFGTGEGEISRGGDLACDGDGFVYAVDRYQGCIIAYDGDRNSVGVLRPENAGAQQLSLPIGIAADPGGLLYVVSMETALIQLLRFTPSSGSQWPGLSFLSPSQGGEVALQNVTLMLGVDSSEGINIEVRLLGGADLDETLTGQTGLIPNSDLVVTWTPDFDWEPGTTYGWQARLHRGEDSGEWGEVRSFKVQDLPVPLALEVNHPNPFNPTTTIGFTAPQGIDATLTILDVRGAVVTQRQYSNLAGGHHTFVWNGQAGDGRTVSSGVYFYMLEAPGFRASRKMALVR